MNSKILKIILIRIIAYYEAYDIDIFLLYFFVTKKAKVVNLLSFRMIRNEK
tara:strand:+ start:1245 stop:1397 length:153 start_codon:yes stop_codon:yes gene_type:complete